MRLRTESALPPPNPLSVEDEVLANIRSQPVGGHTIADFNLPEGFLRRVADRVIRATFIDRHRAVFLDRPEDAPARQDSTAPEASAGPDAVDPYRASLAEERPVLRGFRVPVLGSAAEPWSHTPASDADPALGMATTHVAKRLAIDGLVRTTLEAISLLGPERVLADGETVLRAAGLPTDLLACFSLDDGSSGLGIVEMVAGRLKAGARDEAVRLVSRARFAFRQSIEGFRIAMETGPIKTLRVHFTGSYYWGGRGAGGSMDVIRQLVEALPAASFLAAAENRFLPGIREEVASWNAGSRMRLLGVPHTVSQWAQDNAKPGSADGRSAVLMPRYASRGEQGPIHVPGDSFAAEALVSAGVHVVQSPLLFQGGNILCVDSKEGTRSLIVGEAEIQRNTALGLTVEQSQEALRIEFGAEGIVVLPAVSFHIDFDVLPWAAPEGMLAFVNDPLQAIPRVLRVGANAMVRAGLLALPVLKKVDEDLRAGRLAAAAKALGGPLYSAYSGAFPMSLAKHFSVGESDAGPPNLQRFAVALDMVMSEMGRSGSEAPHATAYLNSFRRMSADRRAIHQQIARHVARVIPVPGISLDGWSFGYLNGLRDGDRYLMPAYSGIYAEVDSLAGESFMRHLPTGCEVVPICCGETQRRSGGLHCAASRH